jgi:myo-inositol-1(or 4)-monophosphatase
MGFEGDPMGLEPLKAPEHGLGMSEELRIALSAAVAGANVIRDWVGRPTGIIEKGVGDLVSEVDKRAEGAVLEVLASSSLRASIVSEESEATMVADSGDCWYVDPLDGTSAFLFRVGDPFPSVLVALHREQLPLVGVVLFPLTGECFYSHAGMGAYKDGRRMELPAPRRLQDVWIDMNQYGNARYETGMFAYLRNKLRTREGAKLVTSFPPHSGVAMRLLDGSTALSAVVHDNNSESVKQAPWDIAAPHAILNEAGGCFLSLRTGEPIGPMDCEPMVVSADRALAMEIIALVR